jgi:arylsulfatase A-like enzyme/Flp pilus assembly protein TadD
VTRIGRAIGFLVLAGLVVSAGCGRDPVPDRLAEAERHRADRRFQDALDEYRLALEDAEDALPILIEVAATHLEAGNPGRAIEVAAAVLERDPDRALAWEVSGAALVAEGALDEAIGHFERAVELEPSNPRMLNRLAIALVNAHRDGQAIAPFERAAAIDPEPSAAVLTHWGTALHRTGRIDEARSRYQAALVKNPDYLPAARNLAMLLVAEEGGLERAVELFEEVARRQPGDPDSLYNLGRAYLETGRWQEAFQLLQRVVAATDPSDPRLPRLRDELERAESRLPRSSSSADAPNVVLIIIDTLRADHVGCYGYPRHTTPAIDGLASRGVLFADAVSAAPWTAASMASVLTGLYPSVHGIQGGVEWPDGMANPDGGLPIVVQQALAPSQLTLAELLRRAGYETAGFVSNVYVHSIFGFSIGFEHYDDRHDDYSGDVATAKRRGDDTNRAIFDWLDGRPAEPFFLLAHFNDPHWPYDPPPPYGREWVEGYRGSLTPRSTTAVVERGGEPITDLAPEDLEYLIGLYDGEVAYADAAVAALVRRLDRLRLDRPLVLILTSDHGEEFLDHGSASHGYTLHEEQIRVPLIILAEPLFAPATVSAQVGLVDLASTILELAGVDRPDQLQGSSLVPLLTGDAASGSRHLFSEATYRGDWRSVRRSDGLKLIRRFDSDGAMLFDLRSDAAERFNLLEHDPVTGDELLEKIAVWMQAGQRLRGDLFRGRSAPRAVVVDPALRQRLEALGYLPE